MVSVESETSKKISCFEQLHTNKQNIIEQNQIGVEAVWVDKKLLPHLHQHKFRKTLHHIVFF